MHYRVLAVLLLALLCSLVMVLLHPLLLSSAPGRHKPPEAEIGMACCYLISRLGKSYLKVHPILYFPFDFNVNILTITLVSTEPKAKVSKLSNSKYFSFNIFQWCVTHRI